MKNLFGFVDRLLSDRVAYYNIATGDDSEPKTKLWMSKSSITLEKFCITQHLFGISIGGGSGDRFSHDFPHFFFDRSLYLYELRSLAVVGKVEIFTTAPKS